MWTADRWKDYEVLDCAEGEKLERWGDWTLIRPDPQVIWSRPRRDGEGGTAIITAVRRAAESGNSPVFRSSGRSAMTFRRSVPQRERVPALPSA